MFVKLTIKALEELREQGYNVLTSVSPLSSEDPVWYPANMFMEELLDLDCEMIRKLSIPLSEPHFLIIEDAIANIDENDLIGHVFLEPLYWR